MSANRPIWFNLNELPLSKRLIAAFLASLVATAAGASEPAPQSQPKLVVGIMVDDLQSEYMSLLRDHFGKDGFNRLLNNGVFIANADYGSSLDATAATALIYTGAYPAVNGIPSDEVFDRSTLRSVPVFNDPLTLGNFTTQTLSPSALAVTTIADEMRIANGGITYAYALAPDASQAIIMAGHAGNCGLWINNANDSWATTTYYKDAPTTLGQRNRMDPLSSRIDTMQWGPMLSREHYELLPDHLTKYPFRYAFKQKGPQKMLAFKNSPKVNDEVTAFAIDNISQLKLGTHDGPDIISVAYTLEPYELANNNDHRYELYDSYYRLDQNLAQLFQAIDKNVGLDNAIIFLAATPPSQRTRRDDLRWQLPYGEFSTRKAISLLNLYLIALHGNGDWVQGYHNGQFFLNHKLIEQQSKDLAEMRAQCASFLSRMAGVTKAYSLDQIIDGSSQATTALRESLPVATAGDILVNVMPGWQIVDDFNMPQVTLRGEKVERAAATTAPVIIMAPQVAPRKIDATIDARSIAPTITRLLRIRSPNAASLPALEL